MPQLEGRPPSARSLLVDIGGGSTEVATGQGDKPTSLYSVPVGAVRLTEIFGSSGTINAIVAAGAGSKRLTLRRLERIVDRLAGLSLAERRRQFELKRAEIIVAGAVILEACMRHPRLEAISAVGTGLRNGVLKDLARRAPAPGLGAGLLEAAALLDDVGHAVSPQRHHKYTFYLVANADVAASRIRSASSWRWWRSCGWPTRSIAATPRRSRRRGPP